MKYTDLDYTYKALELACQWIRNNPPAYFPDEEYNTYVQLFVDGLNRDPQGKDFLLHFLEQAVKELNEKK